MKAKILAISIIAVLALTLSGPATVSIGATARVAPKPAETDSPQARITKALHSSPVMFIQNVGQFNERALFQVRGGDKTIWLTEDGIWVTVLEKPPKPKETLQSRKFDKEAWAEEQPRKAVNIKLSFPGSNPHPRIEPFNRLDTVVSYFIGNDPAKWHVAVPVWGGVRYKDLYPGIDLEISGKSGHLVQRLVAQPWADLGTVHLRVEGADAVEMLPESGLRMRTTVGDFILPFLEVEGGGEGFATVQEVSGRTFEVFHPFTTGGSVESLSFTVHSQQAIPLLYSGFLGGVDWEKGESITVDSSGNVYVTGPTYSFNFPVVIGPDTIYNGGSDVFVAKVSAYGTHLVYSGFLGGSDSDWGYGIAVDSSGNAYVTGVTWSNDFPAVVGPYTIYKGNGDAFVVKVNPAGTTIVYSGFLGGANGDVGHDIAVDSSGNAYVTGDTSSSDFPAVVGPDLSFNGKDDAFVARVNPAGTALVYSGFLGGSNLDEGWGIAVDSSGNAYVTGMTFSSDFPVVAGPDTSYNGGFDAFVTKVSTSGVALIYSGFIGGSGWDWGIGIAVDSSGNTYLTGATDSSNFPVVAGPDTSYNGGIEDAFVAKVSASGTNLVYSGFLGGSDYDRGYGIAVDSSGNVYVTGETSSSDFPTAGAFDTAYSGGTCSNGSFTYLCPDAFVLKVNPAGTALLYSGFLGGTDSDEGRDIAVDSFGNAYVTGGTSSSDFPVAVGPDTSYNGNGDAFVAKVGLDLWIERIDVAQVVLADTKLACGKPTLIRVFARASGTQDVPAVVTVTVRDQNGNDLGAVPIPPTSDVALAQEPEEEYQEDSFNFLIQHPVECPTFTNTITIQASVAVKPDLGMVDTNPSNNEMTISKLFVNVPAVKIGLLPFRFCDSEGCYPPATFQEGKLCDLLKTIYPGEVHCFRMPNAEAVEMRERFSNLFSGLHYRATLKKWWKNAQQQKVTLPDRLYGVVPDTAKDPSKQEIYGIADPKWSACVVIRGGEGRVAVGFNAASTFAHELLHLLDDQGLHHAKWGWDDKRCSIPQILSNPIPRSLFLCDADYPNETGHLDEPGIELSDGNESQVWIIKRAENNYDIMTYCEPEWISKFNYQKLFNGFQNYDAKASNQLVNKANSGVPSIIVSGVVYSDTKRVVFDPILPLGPTAQPDSDEGGDYCLELKTSANSILHRQCFFIEFQDPEMKIQTDQAYFIRTLPQMPGAVEIALTHGGEVLGRVRASNFAPTVRLLRPNGGEIWPAEGTYTVSWEASDGDGDALKFSLYYSPDDGASWSPVALNVEGNQYTVNLSLYSGSEGARFKVVASDGFLFAEDISDAPFRVIAKAPQVEIFSPQSGATLAPGYGALLEGAASDIEDGPIPDDRLTWSSDVDGLLGTGRWIVTTLSPGYHNITLTATDSDGNRGTATIRVYVGYKVYLPLVLRNYR